MAYEGEARSPRAVDWPIALASKALDQAQRLFDSPRSLQLDQEDSNAERPQIQRLEQAVLITADVQFQELDLLIAEALHQGDETARTLSPVRLALTFRQAFLRRNPRADEREARVRGGIGLGLATQRFLWIDAPHSGAVASDEL